MKTINQLRDELLSTFDSLKSGEIDVKVAAEMNNTAGKIIGTVKVELEYSELKNEIPSIAFLEYTRD